MLRYPDQFTLSNRRLPSRAEWQAAIARWDLLLLVTLVEVRPEPGALSRAEIADKPVEFFCEQRTVPSVVGDRHPELGSTWLFAFAFGGNGEMLSSVAAGVAALSYAAATGGVFYLPDVGPLPDQTLFREHLDEVLAVCCGRLDLYRDRYPGKFKDDPGGPFIVTSEVI